MKKICFIGKFNKIYDEEGKALALERLGNKVYRFEEDSFNRKNNDLDALFEKQPDCIFFTKLRVPGSQEIINNAKRNNIKTVCWMPDLYFGLNRETHIVNKTPMFQADYVFTPDGGNDKKFNSLGIKHYTMRQAIAKEACDIIDVPEQNKKINVLFVGGLNRDIHGSDREKLLSFLSKQYKKTFFWVGKNNTNDYREERLTKLISISKVVIGTSVYSPKYWSNRIYETIGRGGMMIHQYVDGIDSEYLIGKHCDFFEKDNFSQLQEKIDFWIDNPKERTKIVKNGYNYTLQFHTLDNRAKKVMEVIYG